MQILDIIDIKELQGVQDMLASATGIASVIVDTKGGFITKPSNFTSLHYADSMEYAEPIIIEGELCGRVLGGQMPADGTYGSSSRDLPVHTEESIATAAKLLGNMVGLLVNFRHETQKNQAKIVALKEDIENMISRTADITSKTRELKKISKEQKILSDNASIEAGRAGDAGKGFRIVANQMGELTESSSKIYETIIEDAAIIHTFVEHLEDVFHREQ